MRVDEAIEEIGGLVSAAGGEGDEALDVLKDAVRTPELMGAFEACQLLGVKSGNLRKTAGLPEPVQELRMGAIWRADEIRRFARERAA